MQDDVRTDPTPLVRRGDGYHLTESAFGPDEVAELSDAVERALRDVVAAADAVDPALDRRSLLGNRLQTLHATEPPTSVQWEPGGVRTVRNVRPVTHLDPRLAARWDDPRLTGPAAELLGVDEIAPLTSKISCKRARVGSAFVWHQDHSFLAGFLGAAAAAEVVTAMVLLDDATAENGAIVLVPGTQRNGPRPDHDPPRPDEAEPVTVEAPAGSVITFPTLMLHRSEANRSDRDRRALFYLFQPAGRPHLDEGL